MTTYLTAAAVLLALGYLIGRARPIARARDWAGDCVRYGHPKGARLRRVREAAIIALLPETFAPILWHRIRTGAYPEPPPRQRVSVTPVRVLTAEERAARRAAREEP